MYHAAPKKLPVCITTDVYKAGFDLSIAERGFWGSFMDILLS